jgi:hypothetical protein
MTRALCLVAALGLGLTGCPSDPAPRPPTAAASVTPSGSVPAPPEVPDPRQVPVGTLLRPAATPDAVLYGDLNGVSPEEIVVLSSAPGDNPDFSIPYLDAFAWNPGDERWVKVLDATGYEDSRTGRGPILAATEGVSQAIPFLQLIDFARDEVPELVIGVQTFGASLGPLELWVLSWPGEAFSTEFTRSTQRGGHVSFESNRITLEAGLYAPSDPGCCPSQIETVVIGWDPQQEQIVVLERTVRDAPEG